MTEKQIVFWVFASGLVLPYCATGLIRWMRRSQELRAPVPKKPNPYQALRSQALQYQRPQGVSGDEQQADIAWAVIMDWGVRRGVATVVAISDGTANIYYSSGGGSIGGAYARRGIRDAALHTVSIAGKFVDMQLTDNFPLPDTGGVAFYVVTGRGVFGAKASEELLRTNQHPPAELGNAMQAIITQYRMLDSVGK